MSLTAEYLGVDSEDDLFRKLFNSFQGFKTRILFKITALTTIQHISNFVFDRNINNSKISIIQNVQRVNLIGTIFLEVGKQKLKIYTKLFSRKSYEYEV